MSKDTGAQASWPCRWKGCTRDASWGTSGPGKHPSKCLSHLQKQIRLSQCAGFHQPVLTATKSHISHFFSDEVNDKPKAWMQASTSSSTEAACSERMDSMVPSSLCVHLASSSLVGILWRSLRGEDQKVSERLGLFDVNTKQKTPFHQLWLE